MNNYKVSITQLVENPNYEMEMENYRERTKYDRGYGNDPSMPQKFIDGEMLSSVVTERQFKAMQKALIETFGYEQEEGVELPINPKK